MVGIGIGRGGMDFVECSCVGVGDCVGGVGCVCLGGWYVCV